MENNFVFGFRSFPSPQKNWKVKGKIYVLCRCVSFSFNTFFLFRNNLTLTEKSLVQHKYFFPEPPGSGLLAQGRHRARILEGTLPTNKDALPQNSQSQGVGWRRWYRSSSPFGLRQPSRDGLSQQDRGRFRLRPCVALRVSLGFISGDQAVSP